METLRHPIYLCTFFFLAYNNTNLIYNLTGLDLRVQNGPQRLKSGFWQGVVPSGGSGRETMDIAFSASRNHALSKVCGLLSCLQSQQ